MNIIKYLHHPRNMYGAIPAAPILYIATMSGSKITPEDQLRVEQTLVKPTAAAWGVKLLKFLKLEKLLKLGNKES